MVSFMPQLLYPGERAPSNHWVGGWVGPRASLDMMMMRKILCSPLLEIKPWSSGPQPSHILTLFVEGTKGKR